jgi:pimeloyl-ACP methyl ester carboxylesterase
MQLAIGWVLLAASTGLTADPLFAQGLMPPADPLVGDGGTGEFYQWDKPVPRGGPRIVRHAALAADKALAEASVNERVLYSSIGGADGKQPIIVSAAVYVPKGKPPRGGWPVIAWAHGTVGFPDICAPSFNGWSERDATYLNTWLRQGYAVVATDYEGLGTNGAHPYMMSRSEAQGVLDAVLAARSRYRLAVDVVIVGQSQGAHAATAAALLQRKIAPSLKLRGVVLTGWPGSANIPPLKLEEFDGWAALYMRYLPTYALFDPEIRPRTMLTPAGLALYERFRTTCGSDAMRQFVSEKPVAGTLFAQDPTPLEERTRPYREYPPLRFTVPVFLGIGLGDEQTSPREAFDSAKRACTLGSRLTVRMYPGVGHAATVLRSQEDSLPWVRQVFQKRVPDSNCAALSFPIASP